MATLYIDTENLKMEYVASHRGGLDGASVTRETGSIAKSVSVYGLDNHIEYLKNIYKTEEVVFCELI